MNGLNQWQNFYVIVGSSAGALIGLQFVVMTLVASFPITHGEIHAGKNFTTPTIVHFGTALLLSAIACAPWHGVSGIATLWGVFGTMGFVYIAIIGRRMRLQTVYQAVAEDWLFHAVLPALSYGTLVASAYGAESHPHQAQFAVGGTVLLLLFIGIHNAWDTAAYHVFKVSKPS